MYLNNLVCYVMVLIFCLFLPGFVTGDDNSTNVTPGIFSLISVPSGADVLIDDVSLGTTPLLFIPNSSIQVPFSLIFRKAGYNIETRTITEIPPSGKTITISISLDASPQFGRIAITASPDGSLVSLDGANPYEVPFTFEKVSAGNHSITVSKSGYKSYENPRVMVNPDSDTSLRVYLISNTENKVLVVTTTPSDADILVDGIYRGTTRNNVPLSVGPLTDGTHSVIAKMTGYKEKETEVVTQEYLSTNLNLELEPLNAAPKPATLKVRTVPDGADVFISGIWVGETPSSGYFELKSLPPNRYILSLILPGYQNITEQIQPKEGEIIIIDKKMIPFS